MKLKNDSQFKYLSDKTLNEINNINKNCDKRDFLSYAFKVFLDAKDRGEIKFATDVWRLSAKALDDFVNKKEEL